MVEVNTLFVGAVIESIKAHISHMPSSEAVLFGMASILLISAIFAFIAKFLRQPLIPAYVLAGVIAGPMFLGLITSQSITFAFLEIGIVFLLFTAGLEISFKKIREVNLTKIMLIGTIQVLLIFIIVLLSRNFLGLDMMQAIYFGIILAFSSTMVDIKLLSDKGELVTLHGRLVLGILLLQDLVAIIAIALLTAGGFAMIPIILTALKLTIIVLYSYILQKFILNRLFKYAAKSTELLFISSLGILFSFIIVSFILEVSIAIGAFIAGVSLANSAFKIELESRISPVKDFFSILFFVALGMQIMFTGLANHITLLLFLIIGALIIKPIILFILLRIGAFQERTSYESASILAQLSEFSLIIGVLGVSRGVITTPLFSTIILATVITMSLTPYTIEKKEFLYKISRKILSILSFLPEKKVHEHITKKHKTVLLIGAHRIGGTIIQELEKDKDKLLVMDYNPEIIKVLAKKEIATIYGDVLSPEIFSKIDIKKLKLVICTLPGFEENMRILKRIKKTNPKTSVIVTGSRISETKELYKKGADFVILPKVIAGQELTRMIQSGSKSHLRIERKKHLEYLEEIHKSLY